MLPVLCWYWGTPLHAQVYIGWDVGTVSYDIRDEYVSRNRYEGVVPSWQNVVLYYSGEKNILNARFGRNSTDLDIIKGSDYYFASNYVEGQNFELDVEYLRKVKGWNSNTELFLGIAHNGHFTYYKRYIESRYVNDIQNSHEMGMLNFSALGMFQYHFRKGSIQYKAGVSLYNYGSRPVEPRYGGDFNYRGMWWNDYFQLQNSLVGLFPLNDSFVLKAEYRLRYYTFRDPQRFKMLKQSFLIGIGVKLW